MFSVMFASTAGFIVLIFAVILRQKIREGHLGLNWTSDYQEQEEFMPYRKTEIDVAPVDTGTGAPLWLTDRGNLRVGPSHSGNAMANSSAQQFKLGNLSKLNGPFNRF